MPIFPERFGTWRGTTLLGNWVPTVAVREDGAWRLDRFGPIGDPFVSQAADYRVAIEADQAQRITGSGTLSKIEQTSEQTRTWTFEASGMRDVAYAASASMRALEQTSGGVVVRSWYAAGHADAGAANLESAASAMSNYTRRFGTLPWDEVDVVLTPGLYGGMEYPGVVFVDQTGNSFEGVPILPELLRFSGFDAAQSRYVIGHELAHQWWYASVGNDQIREPWLDEAMAEISNITWLRATEGSDRTWRMTNLLSDPAVDNDDVFASVDKFSSNLAYTEAVYRGGAGVLLRLRARIGAERFDQVLRTYHEDNQLLIATSDDFLDAIRKVAGESATESFGR
jgi:aminopeptidase N